MNWNELFGTTGQVSWAQECARSVLIFGFGLLMVRIAGRRAFARWSALDIVVAIVAGSSLSRALTGNAALVGTMISTALLMLLHWLLARASARSTAISAVVEGKAINLGSSGKLQLQALLTHNVSEAALLEALRQSGVEKPSGARSIMLEPSGKITVLR